MPTIFPIPAEGHSRYFFSVTGIISSFPYRLHIPLYRKKPRDMENMYSIHNPRKNTTSIIFNYSSRINPGKTALTGIFYCFCLCILRISSPPSTKIVVPVMNRLASLTINATTSPISAGSPNLASGMVSIFALRFSRSE